MTVMSSWHAMSLNEIYELLKSRPNGLSEEEAIKRLKELGPNEIRLEEKFKKLKAFLAQFKNVLTLLLMFSALASTFIGEVKDAVAIYIVLFLNAVLGFVQEYKAEKALEALKEYTVPKATVLRNGKEIVVPSSEIVPGDVVLLKAGDLVPADARLIEAYNLAVDESLLTGESLPVEKSVTKLPLNTPLSERKNMVFSGTSVVRGKGKAIVVATGRDTELGKIAVMLKGRKEKTPLEERIDRFAKLIATIVIILSGVTFVEALLTGYSLYSAFLTSISLAVAAVPEGLPAVISVTLALGVHRMAKRKAIVRRLTSVETLGCTTIICTDKTGTLTKNEMTVREVYLGGEKFKITGTGYEPIGDFFLRGRKVDPRSLPWFMELLTAATLCNDSKLVLRDGNWRVIGDPTEGALLTLTLKAGIDITNLRSSYPRIGEIPFTSSRKMMTTIHKGPRGIVAYSKGAPEALLKVCSRVLIGDELRPLNSELLGALNEVVKEMGSRGLRVLALARKLLPSEEEVVEKDMDLIGLIGILDPPRPEVGSALRKAKGAGIKVIMVTGDHPLTALSIGREIGLKDGGEFNVITGNSLDLMSDEDLLKVVDSIDIYARVTHEHKVRIVKSLKAKGHVVAMTGDGVNDAPSLKIADVGIAMGLRGSEVAKEASDLVLADDNFATIVAAIEEGRGIYSNIRKFILYMLSANWGEIASVMVAALLGLPLPFTPVQILWINLLTDGLPALALGVDPPSPELMKKPPRPRGESIYHGMARFVTISTIVETFSWLAPFYLALKAGDPLARARTLAFTEAVLFELLLSFNCRSEDKFVYSSFKELIANRKLLWAVIGSLALQLAALYLPPLRYLLGTQPLSLNDWLLLLLFSALSIPLSPYLLRSKKG